MYLFYRFVLVFFKRSSKFGDFGIKGLYLVLRNFELIMKGFFALAENLCKFFNFCLF